MTKQPIVSIVLPTFNGEKWIRQSIESVLNQTYQNIELIIVDDCSTDNTATIVDFFRKKDNRIKVIHHSLNKKLPQSLNDGFSCAKGDYFTWTSDDNWYDQSAIEEMVDFLSQNSQFDMVTANFRIFQDDLFKSEYITASSAKNLIDKNTIGACFLYTRKIANIVGEYDPHFFLVEDYDYWIRILLRGKIAHLDKVIYNYRMHEDSLTAQKNHEVKYNELLLKQKYYQYFKVCYPEVDLEKINIYINYFKVIDEVVKKVISKSSKSIYIYGAGFICYLLLKKMQEHEITVETIFDSSAQDSGFLRFGYRVHNLNNYAIKDDSVMIIASDKYANEIKSTITNYQKEYRLKVDIIQLDFSR